jgi:hypothetical protein
MSDGLSCHKRTSTNNQWTVLISGNIQLEFRPDNRYLPHFPTFALGLHGIPPIPLSVVDTELQNNLQITEYLYHNVI